MRLRHIAGSRDKLLELPELVLCGESAPAGRWRDYFAGRGAGAKELCLEIGCGRGRFINELAVAAPDKAFIGLELHEEVICQALEKYFARPRPVDNLAFLWLNANELQGCFAPGEVDKIYLNFSDPWPKKKHAKRRLTYDKYLAVYAGLLREGGELCMKTDNRQLFEFSLDRLLACGWRLLEIDWDYPECGASDDRPTEYEMRFRRLGQPIYRLRAVYGGKGGFENNADNNYEVKDMQYTSTRGQCEPIGSAAAIRSGMAADGGLFVPTDLPAFPYNWEEMAAMSYRTLAEKVLGLFLTDYQPERLAEIVAASYGSNFATEKIAPLTPLADNMNILELWHGPTAAFKDMALQILPRLLTEAVKIEGGGSEVDILVATSGDTGKAALEGFKNVPGIKVICFYPDGGVSRAQYLQMATTEGDNVNVVAVRGNFDNCQTGVKEIFGDAAMAGRMAAAGKEFSSANSINWGRLCPQIVYYFWSYAELLRQGRVQAGEQFDVVVPTGNFGNILAAYYAREMGLPIGHLICASNSNKVLADVLASGVYDKRRDFVKTTSPSMDILVSSNFERFYYAMTGGDAAAVRAAYSDLAEKGVFTAEPEAVAKWQSLMSGGFADEERVAATIRKYFDEQGYTLDPHTAVAVAVYEDYLAGGGTKRPVVIASTASPFKFGRAVLAAVGSEAAEDASEDDVLQSLSNVSGTPVHHALAGLESKPILHDMVIDAAAMPAAVAGLLEI